MIHSLAGTFRVVFWAGIMVTLMMTVWSIIAVDIIHPLNLQITRPDDKICRGAFESVYNSNLTFFQVIVAGDSFGLCTLPIMRKHPWTVFYFTGVLATVGLGALNLILSAIVDRAQEVRTTNEHMMHQAKMVHYEKTAEKLKVICAKQIDVTSSGKLSMPDIMDANENNDDFSDAMEALDLGSADLGTVFYMMDEEKRGVVDHAEFVDHLLKLKTQDQHMLLILIKQHLNEAKSTILESLTIMKEESKEIHRMALSVGTAKEPHPYQEIHMGDTSKEGQEKVVNASLATGTVNGATPQLDCMKTDVQSTLEAEMQLTLNRLETMQFAHSSALMDIHVLIKDTMSYLRITSNGDISGVTQELPKAGLLLMEHPTSVGGDLIIPGRAGAQPMGKPSASRLLDWSCCDAQHPAALNTMSIQERSAEKFQREAVT
jgi:hypothetical protein